MRALVLFALVGLFAQTYGAALCHFGEGRDMCHAAKEGKPCAPLVVRPARIPRLNLEELSKPRVVCKKITVPGLANLRPIGDLCSCKQSIVVPANVPRPACLSQSVHSTDTHNTNSMRSTNSAISYVPSVTTSVTYHPQVSSGSSRKSCTSCHNTGYLADPVSLSLAYKQRDSACGISEDRLAFGFRKVPKNAMRQIETHNRHEENLAKINGQVMELKRCSCKSTVNVDDEAMEDLLAEEMSEHSEEMETENCNVKKLSLGEIGFGPSKVKAASFVAVPSHHEISTTTNTHSKSSASCRDGFLPGNVIIKNVPRKETYVEAHPDPHDCDDDVVPMRYVSSYATSSSSHQSHEGASHHFASALEYQ